jgi:hypothetical protein
VEEEVVDRRIQLSMTSVGYFEGKEHGLKNKKGVSFFHCTNFYIYLLL